MEFDKVTWYSKLAALILFISLPFLGFWAGMKYQRAVSPNTTIDQSTATNSSKKSNSSTNVHTKTEIVLKTDQVDFVGTYRDGVWKYSGIVRLPDSCTTLTHDAVVRESFPEQVSIDITTKKGAQACAQVITPKTFSGELKVSQNATISLTLDGKIIK